MPATLLSDPPIRDRDELARFETAIAVEPRLPERSVPGPFATGADLRPQRAAITLLIGFAPADVRVQVSEDGRRACVSG